MTTAWAEDVVVLFNDTAVEVEKTLPDPNDLWVTPEDLTRINGFVLKPEGACLDALCIPVRQDQNSDLLVTREGQKWFNVTELARKLQQAFVVDRDTSSGGPSVWSFGAIPAVRAPFLSSARAPDFALKDRAGKTVRLKDFRGKKLLIITWASW